MGIRISSEGIWIVHYPPIIEEMGTVVLDCPDYPELILLSKQPVSMSKHVIPRAYLLKRKSSLFLTIASLVAKYRGEGK